MPCSRCFLPSKLGSFLDAEGHFETLFYLLLHHVYMKQTKKKNPVLCQVFLERTSFADNHFHVLPAPWCVKAIE